MRKIIFATAAATAALAYSADLVETVTVKGSDGAPLRINKADYDADQAEDGAKAYTLHKTDAEQSVPGGGVQTFEQLGIPPVAAPSAPDFSGGGAPAIPIDPAKNAAAPVAPSPGQKLVTKEGTGTKERWFVVDATGTKLTGDGIEEKGYTDEKAAWDAALALPATPPAV